MGILLTKITAAQAIFSGRYFCGDYYNCYNIHNDTPVGNGHHIIR